ncbi:RICIN domain-containing protein [Streptomyces sp. BR123]|uniref:RICIN domain-containing protein n=1 Tax=Streptomyces sp. BR123 TaxID=2749828 RepID=UPI0015C49398|nr:RICIN domain-containing protein [Streptomyces sp. BR123]NXY96430.1 RICIN domain-containing protein [Streptomyces sp. BR123]
MSTADDFIAALRALKARSGLTLRDLESRAAARGDVLPRSTVADVLRKQTLPRREWVAAFVRACDDQDRLGEWLGAWQRLANEGPETSPTDADPSSDADTPRAAPRARAAGTKRRKRMLIVAAALALAGATAAGTLVANGLTTTSGPRTAGAAGARLAGLFPLKSAGSWALIRPAQATELCLTAGRERSGRYPSEVAVQRPCTDPGPRTFLQPVADGLTTIKWEHPVDKGMGCLTVMDSGIAEGLVEPRESCQPDKDGQLFRIESVGAAAEGFRLRRGRSDLCLGIRDGAAGSGVELVQESCGSQPGQRFLIDLIPH